MARISGSWLSGPEESSDDASRGEYPGQLLGLPKNGAGSLVPMPKRILALFVDWFIAMGVAAMIVRPNADAIIAKAHVGPGQHAPSHFEAITSALATPTWATWFVIGLVTVTLFGFTPGQFFLRMRVARVDADAPVGFVRALARQVLLVFVVPALFTDSDGRGMHDRATGTGLVRTR